MTNCQLKEMLEYLKDHQTQNLKASNAEVAQRLTEKQREKGNLYGAKL